MIAANNNWRVAVWLARFRGDQSLAERNCELTMNSLKSATGLTFILIVTGSLWGQAPRAAENQLNAGRQTGWQLVQLVVEKLDAGPGGEFPGIAAWKQDFATATRGIDAAAPADKWPAVAMDA
ncbi:MAG TPA: hypothetical protein VFB80_23100, partial [Pirellulaceae bacterium]|nr:hypothetical protein [Pirellulaceae bacterium]